MKRPKFITEKAWREMFPNEKKGNKYNAQKVKLDGFTFDSKFEAGRYAELKLLLSAGEIRFLEVHPRYDLFVNDVKVSRYTPDFTYYLKGGSGLIVEDTKGVVTEAYRIRKKLMKACHGLDVIEVRKPKKRGKR